jgi:hypothetical protein
MADLEIAFGNAACAVLILGPLYIVGLLIGAFTMPPHWSFSSPGNVDHHFWAVVRFDPVDQPHLWLFWCASVSDSCENGCVQRHFIRRRHAIAWAEASYRACCAARALAAMGPVKEEPAA